MKKQLLSLALAVILLAVLLPGLVIPQARANDTIVSGWCGDYVTWELDKQTGVLTVAANEGAPNGDIYDYIHEWDYQDPAPFMQYDSFITSVVVEPGVTYVGNYAFAYLRSLKTVTLPNTVTAIGKEAFSYDEALESINIPDSVTSLGNFAISRCHGLKSVTVPASVKEFGSNIFFDCRYMTSITLPDNMTEIPSGFLQHCSSLTEINIPKTVTTIGVQAFYGCDALTSVTVPEGVTSIEDSAFSGCDNLREIKLPNSLTFLDERVFTHCGSLEKIEIPAGVTSIGQFTFAYCYDLASIKFLGNAPAFPADYAQKDTVFSGVRSMGLYPAGNTTWTASVKQNYGGTIYWMPYDPETGAILPDEPENIVKGKCGDNVTWELDLSSGEMTLSGTGSMYDYDTGDDGTDLAPWTIHRPNILSLEVKAGVESIGSHAFDDCTSLKTVTLTGTVKQIGKFAFDGCVVMTPLNLPEGLTTIGHRAFSGCNSLTAVVLPESVTTVESYAFSSCKKLTGVTLPSHFTVIPEALFFNCPKLSSFTVPEGVTAIGSSVFFDCTGLKTVVLPDTLKSIGYNAFAGCRQLAGLVLPAGLTELSGGAFQQCMSLTSLTIPRAITTLRPHTFSNCTGLEEVFFLADAPEFAHSYIGTVLTGTPDTIFSNVTTKIYYPMNNATWTVSVMKNYGGQLTWLPYIAGTDGEGGMIRYDAGSIGYYIDGVRQYDSGLIRLDGNYYYILPDGEAAVGSCYVCFTNGLMPPDFYIFDDLGRMRMERTGVFPSRGALYYFVDGEMQYGSGLIRLGGAYYYIRSNGQAAVGGYFVTNTNGLLAPDYYIFGTDGRMYDDSTGIREVNGTLYYFIEGEMQYGSGLILLDGSYYYVRSSGQVAVGLYWVTNTNGLLPAGAYTFDQNGKMLNPPTN